MIRNVRGIAQLVALWALLLLGVLAMSFAYSMRTEAQAARNGADAARAYFQARTGINRAIAELSSAPLDEVLAAGVAGTDGDAVYAVDVQSERGKIDLNFVSEPLLKEVLRNAGLSPEDADAAGDSILSWKDESRSIRFHAATEADYAALPDPVKPRYGKFASVEELRSVRGISPAVFRRLAKLFTVDARTPQIDVNRAPVEVLRVLPGFSAETADAVAARRKEAPFATPAEFLSFIGRANVPDALFGITVAARASGAFTLTSTGTAGNGIVRAVRCTVEFGSPGRDAKILRWADHVPAGEEAG